MGDSGSCYLFLLLPHPSSSLLLLLQSASAGAQCLPYLLCQLLCKDILDDNTRKFKKKWIKTTTVLVSARNLNFIIINKKTTSDTLNCSGIGWNVQGSALVHEGLFDSISIFAASQTANLGFFLKRIFEKKRLKVLSTLFRLVNLIFQTFTNK